VVFHDRRLDTNSSVGVGAWPTSKTEAGNYLVWNWGAQCRITQTQTVTRVGTRTVPNGASQCVAPEAVVNPTAVTGFNPGSGTVPGNNQNANTLPFRNFQISDFGSNFDYAFRAGIFAGDYNGNATGAKLPSGNDYGEERTAAFFTDARNGRGSGDPTSTQPGRNPICEQSDVFFDSYSSQFGGLGARGGGQDSNMFLIAPCPSDIKDHRQHW